MKLHWMIVAVVTLWPHGPVFAAPTAGRWAEAEAKVAAAQDTADKLVALYELAGVPLKFLAPTRADWEKAGKALDELFKLLVQTEKSTGKKLTGVAGFYFRRGYVAAQLGNYEGAIRFYDQAEQNGYLLAAFEGNNKGGNLLNNRAEARAALYDFAGALADFDKAVALEPKAYLWLENRAQTRFEAGDYDGAVADWKRAGELGGGAADYPLFSDQFLDGTPRKERPEHFDRAQIPFNKAIAANPRSATPFLERARYFAKNSAAPKRLKSALRDLNRAIEVEPKRAEAWRERGRVRATLLAATPNDTTRSFSEEDVINDFQQAIRLDPKDALTRFQTGAYFLARRPPSSADEKKQRDGDLLSAIMNFSRAIYMAPDKSGEAHFQRALAERQKNSPDANTLWADYTAVIAQKLSTPGETRSEEETGQALATAHMMRGKILLRQGKRGAALDEFDAALKYESDNLEALYERGKLRVARGDYDAALEDLSRLTKVRPSFAEGWLWRAAARDGKGETGAARLDLKEALQRDVALRDRVWGTRYDEANPTKTSLAPVPDKNDLPVLKGTALDHKNVGNNLRGKGDLDGALAEYNTALLIDANFADGYNNRAAVYHDQGKIDLALADVNRALEIEPKHRVAFFVRAQIWDQLNETERQRADLDRAIEYADNAERKAAAYGARSLMRQSTNDRPGALSDAQMVTELLPDKAESWRDLGHIQLNAARTNEAIGSYRRALEINPKLFNARLFLAMGLAILNDDAAARELETALATARPDEVEVARRALSNALRVKPDSAPLKALRDQLPK